MSNHNNNNKPVDPGETMHLLAEQGKELIQQGNRRRIIARDPEGNILLDISLTQAVIVSALTVLVLPMVGWLILLAIVGIGISKKVRIDLVRELTDADENATISVPRRKHKMTLEEQEQAWPGEDNETISLEKQKNRE